MNLEESKSLICSIVDDISENIISIADNIFANPELGYKEFQTSELVEKHFNEIGLEDIEHCAITGVKGWLRNKTGTQNRPSLAIIGELDAVISPLHPNSCSKTHAAHACGHHAQLAAMLGCAQALKKLQDSGVLLADVCFFAVPAEEYIEQEYRHSLVKEGKINFIGGKQELIAKGFFDDIDIAMMFHAETVDKKRVVVHGKSSGFIGKTINFTGKEAHAGAAPFDGINALNAATLAITAIHYQRETFRDLDGVRVHPIITKGGDIVNTVPADVKMESYVRANSVEAMQSANNKVNRAIEGAAYAIGAKVDIEDFAGYLPMQQSEKLSHIFADNAASLVGAENVEFGLPFSGSTDMGDLSVIIPIIQPTVSGFSGDLHSKDFTVTDKNFAYITPTKLLAMTAIDLLFDNAALAEKVISDFYKENKRISSKEYVKLWNDILEP